MTVCSLFVWIIDRTSYTRQCYRTNRTDSNIEENTKRNKIREPFWLHPTSRFPRKPAVFSTFLEVYSGAVRVQLSPIDGGNTNIL